MTITKDTIRTAKHPSEKKILLAGHLCLDQTPDLFDKELPKPGKLASTGPLHISVGGAEPNVGSALYRLGYQTALVALLGDDWLSQICLRLLEPLGHQAGLRIEPNQSTSYSIVIAPEGEDRSFLHCLGVNAKFVAADVHDADLDGVGWMHFGYPPVMPAMSASDGQQLAAMYRRAAGRGIRTSLDFCALHPSLPPAKWEIVLRNCAECVTLFAPSIDELRSAFECPSHSFRDISDVPALARQVPGLGFSMVAVKLGIHGLYLATADTSATLEKWGLGAAWRGRELIAPCYQSDFVNASGAGDCTIAGLIAAIVDGCGPEEAVTRAVTVGACSAEAAWTNCGTAYKKGGRGSLAIRLATNGVSTRYGLWTSAPLSSN